MLVLTTTQMKRAEQLAEKAGLSYMNMLRNAGAMAFQYCEKQFDIHKKTSVILCGNGNNGGDGVILAKKITESGGRVSVVLCCSLPSTCESIEAFAELQTDLIEVISTVDNYETVKERLSCADIIIDAVYGTGFRGNLNKSLSDLFQYANSCSAYKIALDIPSGIHADTARCSDNHFTADTTLAFAAQKLAHKDMKSQKSCGIVAVLDIGIPQAILNIVENQTVMITTEMITTLLPHRHQNSHKGNYGKLLNISGSKTMGGAAMMSTLAALRMGAGVTTLATPVCVAQSCAGHLMEAITYPLAQTSAGTISVLALDDIDSLLKSATSCLIGCGLSVTSETIQIVEYAINNTNCSIVLDADALNCVASKPGILKTCKAPVVITPHLGEMARLTDKSISDISFNPASIATSFSKENNVIVVLKGHHTVIATPSGELYENTSGNAGLAKGGSGDVLAGMIAALLAQGMEAKNAAICGVYLHGLTADKLSETMSQSSMLARDIIAEIPFLLKSLEQC